MSIIICKHCERHIDTDFNAEHEEECGQSYCSNCGEECEDELCDDCEEAEIFANKFG